MHIRSTLFALVAVLLLSIPAMADHRRTPVVKAVESVSPSVVNITVVRKAQRGTHSPFGDPFFDQFFRGRQPRQSQSLGSGVIINGAKALVLTNAHVVAKGGVITVRLNDGREFKATWLALTRISIWPYLNSKMPLICRKFPWVIRRYLYRRDRYRHRQPFGYSHTVTTGVVSALNRPMKTDGGAYGSFIQTDAAINPGNSGAALLNINGRLIGINTAILARAEGIGFAIPINKAKFVVDELLNAGHVAPIWLGISDRT